MILTLEEILKEVGFEPGLDEFQVNPHAIDLRLEKYVTLPPWTYVKKEDMRIGSDNHVLVKTLETVKLPNNVVGIVYPRSSTNRRGITLDMTGIVDAGYHGTLTLPLTNWTNEEIKLKKGERIASIVFHRLLQPVKVRLSKYHNSDGSYKPDKSIEEELIQSGDLEKLKCEYGLDSQ